MGQRWTPRLLLLLLLLPGGNPQDTELLLVAPRQVALGTPLGVLLASEAPAAGTVTAWAAGGGSGAGPCAPQVPFDLGTHNHFSQILSIEVSREQAERCGALEATSRGQPQLLLEALSPPLPPRRVRVGLGGPQGALLVQTDKPLYAPQQTVRFRIFSLDPELQPSPEPILITITNPLGALVREVQKVPTGMVLSDQLQLPDIATVGQWHIRARLANSPETFGATSFSVRPYALPPFSLRLLPSPNFLLLEPGATPALRLRLRVRYHDGTPVEGRAQLRVGLSGGPDLRGALEKHSQVTSGGTEFNLTLDDVIGALGVAPRELQGKRLRLAATVMDRAGGQLVRQETGVGLVMSPWSLDLSSTPQYFIPGAPITVRGRVLHAGGGAAAGVEVQVRAELSGADPDPEPLPELLLQTDPSGSLQVALNVPSQAKELRLSVQAGSAGSPPARAELRMTAMTSASGRFLLLLGPAGPLHPGDTLRVRLQDLGPPPAPHTYHLLAVSRGRLVASLGVPRGEVTEVSLPVSSAMLPRLRLVAFCRAGGELLAASWALPVLSSCHRQVRVGVSPRGPLRPQTPVTVTVTLGAELGRGPRSLSLAATDAALLELEPRHRLHPAKVQEVLGSSDLGCGTGGGPDPEGIFWAAGLALGGTETPPELAPGCPSSVSRSRRSLSMMEILDKAGGAMPLPRRCCRDGLTTLPLPASCARRGRRVPEAEGCRRVFLSCCRRAKALRGRAGQGLGGARALFSALAEELWGEEEEEEQVPARSFFPETWLWRSDIGTGTARFSALLPDSITTWQLQIIAVVPGHGLCLPLPLSLAASQELSLRLQLPPAARPREQLQLLPHIHSSLPHGLNVSLSLAVPEGACAGLGRTPRALWVPPGGVVAVPVPLVPLRPGHLPLTFTLTARGRWGVGDSVTRVLHVQPEGELHLEEKSYILDTSEEGARSLQIPGEVPAGVVPEGEFSTSVRVTGRVGGWALRGALGLGPQLLRAPRGCGEQALMALAPRVTALRYMDLSGSWGALPAHSRAKSLRGLQSGFERLQSFRKPEGSYSAWQHRRGSTWLTALVLRSLALARPYLLLPPGGPEASLQWLLQQQRPDGAFLESEALLHREMQGSLAEPGPDASVSLTAFVVLALQSSRSLLPPECPLGPDLDKALSQAATFLSGRLGALGTFGTAITAYALALVDTAPPGPSPALQRLEQLARPAQGGRAQFWPAGGAAATVEATAYGVLALLQQRRLAAASRAARWLRQQSNYGGGFRSTQDTMVALEALAQMWLQWGEEGGTGLSLRLSWQGQGRGAPGGVQLALGAGLKAVEQELQVPLGSSIQVHVEGLGEGTLTVLRQFRLLSPLNLTCQGLGLQVAITGPIIYEEEDYEDYKDDEELEEGVESVEGAEPTEGEEPALATASPGPEAVWEGRGQQRRRRESAELSQGVAFTVCMWREPGVELSGMAVAELFLLSGFQPLRTDLDKLQGVVDRWISHYELSETRLVLYLDEVPTQRHCLHFGARQEVAVGELQPAMATLYDYYEPARRCSCFYSAPHRSSLLPTLCSSALCLCAQAGCAKLRQGVLTLDERLDFACYSPRVNHALLVQVLNQSEAGPFQAFNIQILEVLLGEDSPGGRGQVLARAGCALRLRPQRRYLLMGKGRVQEPRAGPQFLLDADSWLEEVLPRPRCGSAPSCHTLQDFMDTLRPIGCPL